MTWYRGMTLGRKILTGYSLVACISGLSGVLSAGSIIQQVTGIFNASASGTQQFATAAAGMHLMAEELQRIVSGFTLAESCQHV